MDVHFLPRKLIGRISYSCAPQKMRVQIAGRCYATKKICKAHVTSVLSRLVGWEIRPHQEHYSLVNSLWQRCPAHVAGVEYFIVIEVFGKPALKAVTSDSSIEFSIRQAISGKWAGRWTQLTSAMRGIIRPQIRAFKASTEMRCKFAIRLDSVKPIMLHHSLN